MRLPRHLTDLFLILILKNVGLLLIIESKITESIINIGINISQMLNQCHGFNLQQKTKFFNGEGQPPTIPSQSLNIASVVNFWPENDG